jgi:hypothetical protein
MRFDNQRKHRSGIAAALRRAEAHLSVTLVFWSQEEE